MNLIPDMLLLTTFYVLTLRQYIFSLMPVGNWIYDLRSPYWAPCIYLHLFRYTWTSVSIVIINDNTSKQGIQWPNAWVPSQRSIFLFAERSKLNITTWIQQWDWSLYGCNNSQSLSKAYDRSPLIRSVEMWQQRLVLPHSNFFFPHLFLLVGG